LAITPSPKRLAIVGAAASYAQAPYEHPDWDVWIHGAASCDHPRFDRFFELHDVETAGGARFGFSDFAARAADTLWVFDPGFTTASQYPKQAVEDKYGTEFLTSTAAWMMALAIDEGFTEIGIWGIEMELAGEYAYQRPGLMHFILLARAMGIKVRIPEDSFLSVQHEPYPTNYGNPVNKRLRNERRLADAGFDRLSEEILSRQLQRAELVGRRDAFDLVLMFNNTGDEI